METIELPLQTRADVRLQPDTIDAQARTVELVWSTGSPVRRRDFFTGRRYDEVLSLDRAHVDLSRLNAGAPLLNAHGAYTLLNVLGVVERAWITEGTDGPQGRAIVRFSEREDVEPLWQDVQAGIIRNVSVGYAVRAYEVIEEDGQVPVWRAIDWQPLELSAVPIGADPTAGFRGSQTITPCHLIHRAAAAQQPESKAMDPVTPAADSRTETPIVTREDTVTRDTVEATGASTPASRADAPAADPVELRKPATAEHGADAAGTEDIARRVLAEERARIAGIYDAARKLGLDQAVADTLVRDGVTLDQSRGRLIDKAAERDRAIETRPHIRMGGLDERETRKAAVETALLHRFDPHRYALSEPARDWRGYSLIEMARTLDATPDAFALKRFSQGRGFITRGGVPLAGVTGGNLTFSNNLERVRVIRDDGKIEAAEPTFASCQGAMTVRFDGATLMAEAANSEPVAIEYGFTTIEGFALTIELFRVFLPKPKYAISGPGGVEASFDWRAAYDEANATMLRARLLNDVATYA